MAGFDDLGVYYSDNLSNLTENQPTNSDINLSKVKRDFRDFLKQYHEGDFVHKYR